MDFTCKGFILSAFYFIRQAFGEMVEIPYIIQVVVSNLEHLDY